MLLKMNGVGKTCQAGPYVQHNGKVLKKVLALILVVAGSNPD